MFMEISEPQQVKISEESADRKRAVPGLLFTKTAIECKRFMTDCDGD